MTVLQGSHRLGPGKAELSVHTGRGGAAAKAGHDLVIVVGSWDATLVLGEDPTETTVELSADSSSLRVIEGSGGVQALGDDDKANIEQTINDEVLQRREIGFRSSGAEAAADGSIIVTGELTIGEQRGPLRFELEVGDGGKLRAGAVVKQTEWGIKPYSALFGTLKVSDEVEVRLEGQL